MQAGKLDRRITVQELTSTPDSFGGAVETWETLAPIWAGVQEGSGREYFAAARVNSEVSAVFETRYRSDLTSANRISYNGKFYNILSVSEIGRRKGLLISAKADANG
ncbi:MAG: phage head closure protein [Sneathiella sp.]